MSVKVENLNMYFGKKQVLYDIHLDLEKGIYGLMGPNGAGKTTLMRILTGLLKSKEGQIRIDGKLGYLSQHYGAFKDFTCLEMLDYYVTYRKEKMERSDLSELLEKVHLGEEKNKKIKNLSGGMLRRLGIAQSLLGNPDVIILDEPLVALDPEERVRIKEILKTLKEDKIVLISTHIVEDIDDVCNHYLIMKQGKMIFEGDKEALLNTAKDRSDKEIHSLEEGYLCIVQN